MGKGIDFLKSVVPFLSPKDKGMCLTPKTSGEQFIPDKSDIPPGYNIQQDENGEFFYYRNMRDPAGQPICDPDGYQIQEIVYFQD